MQKFNLQPIYFLAGDDIYALDEAILKIKSIPEIASISEMDTEVYSSKNLNLGDILDNANQISFITEYRLVIIKEFNKVISQLKKKKNTLRERFIQFLKEPSETTFFILIYPEKISKDDKGLDEILKIIKDKGYYFEFNKLKADELYSWVEVQFKNFKKDIDINIIQAFVELVGEERYALKNEITKIVSYVENKPKIELEDIIKVVSAGKEYTIFDLQRAISNFEKEKAYKIVNNLLYYGTEPLVIIFMLTKYFMVLMRLKEIIVTESDSYKIARMVEVSPYFINEYKSALRFFTIEKLEKIFKFLLECDIAIKSSDLDKSTLILMLLNIIFE
ncbi:MAG TPA: DNA polymerase III subunit delta [Ignavibacteriales bacterium]|jgi:DNA polymerase-3 subunit delta|nr:DNA polymerase III subunit delta [Ignavibacteriales bacterium]